MGFRPNIASREPALIRFAKRLRDELGAERVLVFGSQARGTAAPSADYDLIVVAEHFRDVPSLKRGAGLRSLFYSVGGDAPLDLICLTPAEFEQARRGITLVSEILPEAVDLLAVSVS